MQKNQSKNSESSIEQLRLIQNLEGAGDILVFETKKAKNEIVKNGIKEIYEILKMLFELQKENPEKFERLLLKDDYFKLYQEDKEKAGSALFFFPEELLVGLSIPLNQLFRIHNAALETKNDEISRHVSYHLVYILSDIAKTKENNVLIEEILKNITRVSRKAITKNDASMYSSTFHWYTDIVFNMDNDFNIEYLELFNKYFSAAIQYVISENNFTLFKELVKTLVDGIHVSNYPSIEIWSYRDIILLEDGPKYFALDEKHSVDEMISGLEEAENNITSKKSLDAWVEKFSKVKSVLYPQFNNEQKIKADELENNIINSATLRYKFSNLLDIVFTIGTYCIFKNKPEYIKYFWEFKQPTDSEVSWVGHNIIQETPRDVIKFYFQKSYVERKIDFWEDHHGSEIYAKKYFLLLLAKSLQQIKANSQTNQYDSFRDFNISDIDVYRLSDIEHSTDNLIEIAKNLKNETDILLSLGFAIENNEDLFDKKLVPFLQNLKDKAKEGIEIIHKEQSPSPIKIEKFKKEVISEFKKSEKFRDLFDYLKIFEDKGTELNEDIKKYGFNIVEDKAIFFEKWHIHYNKWGNNYGRDLVHAENTYVTEQIKKACAKIELINLDSEIIQSNSITDIVLIATNQALSHFFDKQQSFISKWRSKEKISNIENFEGWYTVQNNQIPVFQIYDNSKNNFIFVINKKRFGKLLQYSPLDKSDKETDRYSFLFMLIEAFSENTELMNTYLNKPPKWLEEIGGQEAQESYLKEKIAIQIFEKITFIKDANFNGKVIDLGDA